MKRTLKRRQGPSDASLSKFFISIKFLNVALIPSILLRFAGPKSQLAAARVRAM